MISFAFGFVAGVIAVIVFNHFYGTKVDKASQELADEVNDRLRGDK